MFIKSPFSFRKSPITSSAFALMLMPFSGLGIRAAHADVVTAFYNSDTHFSYHITQMPDLDQVRFGLIGTGRFHCVPTASMNLMIYAANHGFPDVAPGAANWQLQANHALGTQSINSLGQMMQTWFTPGDPFANPPTSDDGGTGGDNADAGFAQWLQPYDYFVWGSNLTAPNFTVNFNNIAKSVISGNIGTMSYGFYDVVGTAAGGVPIVNRDGGHATTIVRCYRNGEDMELWVRDPADSNDSEGVQSPFANRIWTITNQWVWVQDDNNPPTMQFRNMSAMNWNPGSGKVRLIDGHRALRPKTGYSFSSQQGTLGVLSPNDFGGNPGTTILAPATPITGCTFNPQINDFLMIAGSPTPSLFVVNPATSQSEPLKTPATPAFIRTANNGCTFLITADNVIHKLDPELNLEISAPLLHDAVPTEELSLNFSKIEFDAGVPGIRNPSVVVATMIDRKVMFYPTNLATPVVRDIPSLLRGDILSMAVEPSTGRVWFCLSGTNTLYGVLWSGTAPPHVETLSLATIIAPTGIDFDDAGSLYVCASSQLNVLRRNAASGTWNADLQSPFHGGACSGEFVMMRNSSTYDPQHHDNPSWTKNIDPAQLEFGDVEFDCPGDIVASGNVDVDDLVALLGAWGRCAGCTADLNSDGLVNVDDLVQLLGAWGVCD